MHEQKRNVLLIQALDQLLQSMDKRLDDAELMTWKLVKVLAQNNQNKTLLFG